MQRKILTLVVAMSVLSVKATAVYADTIQQTDQQSTIVMQAQQQNPIIQQMLSYMKDGRIWGPDQASFEKTAATYFSLQGERPSSWAVNQVAVAIALGEVPTLLQGNYQQAITREELTELFVTTIFAEFDRQHESYHPDQMEAWKQKNMTLEFFNQQVKKVDYKGFSDVSNPYVDAAIKLGITKGVSADKFNPSGKLTREEFAVMLHNYAQVAMMLPTDSVSVRLDNVSGWAKESVTAVTDAEHMTGVTKVKEVKGKIVKAEFNPKGVLSREQAIVALSKYISDSRLRTDVIHIDGFLCVDMDMIQLGLEINGNQVKLLNTDYDTKSYVNASAFYMDGGDDSMWGQSAKWQILAYFGDAHISQSADEVTGKNVIYDNGAYKTEKNPTDSRYWAIVTKNNWKGHLSLNGGQNWYTNQSGERVAFNWGNRVK